MTQRPFTFASYLAPALYPTYQATVDFVQRYVGVPMELYQGDSFSDFTERRIDAGFMCGLAYTRLVAQEPGMVAVVAAPVVQDTRYAQRPHYFSDIIVQADSPFRTFDDLRGKAWAYNEQASYSGYVRLAGSLLERGETPNFFGSIRETGSHARSIRAVLDGQVDAAAIDSHLLDVLRQQHHDLYGRLRIVTSLGPSPIPPVVVATHVESGLKRRIAEALQLIQHDAGAVRFLNAGHITHFVPVRDADYDPIRAVDKQVRASPFYELTAKKNPVAPTTLA